MTAPTLTLDDLIINHTPRVPVAICLDVSGSMAGQPIAELAQGVHTLFAELYDNALARASADVAVVTFGARIDKIVDFGPVQRKPFVQMLADGLTPMGTTVNYALDLLEARKQDYKAAGVSYYQPWLILMTDGAPTDDITAAVRRTAAMASAHKLLVIPVGVGQAADLGVLSRFSPQQRPLRLRGLAFTPFFRWLSASIERVSNSTVGTEFRPFDASNARASWAL